MYYLYSQPIDDSDSPTVRPITIGEDRVVYLDVLKTLDDRQWSTRYDGFNCSLWWLV